MRRIFSPCLDCEFFKDIRTCHLHGTNKEACEVYAEWMSKGYWEDYMPEVDDTDDEREEAFTAQERNPGLIDKYQ